MKKYTEKVQVYRPISDSILLQDHTTNNNINCYCSANVFQRTAARVMNLFVVLYLVRFS